MKYAKDWTVETTEVYF